KCIDLERSSNNFCYSTKSSVDHKRKFPTKQSDQNDDNEQKEEYVSQDIFNLQRQ
ncbi:Hypothetical predicted protein, partial [Paramuricea clavata]